MRYPCKLVAILSLAALHPSGGCTESPSRPSPTKPTPTPSTSTGSPSSETPATPPASTELFGTAVLKGRVTFEGDRPAPKKIAMTGDSVCQSSGAPVYEEGRTITQDGGVPHVFVYIKQGISGKYPVPSEHVVLDQKGCMYEPHVFGIQVGQTLTVTNSDPTAHNIHSLAVKNPQFNIAQATRGLTKDVTFKQSEVMVKVKCDVHGWMSSFAGVLNHPFFAVTDAQGRFEIPRLPAGQYTVETWHELFQKRTRSVTLTEGQTLELNFVYSKDAKP